MNPCIEIHQDWWQWHPPVGTFIAALAFLGVVVPLFRSWNIIGPREKVIWTAAMFILVGLEIHTLYLDRDEHDKEQALARCQQLQSFHNIAASINTAITTSQNQFHKTMKGFSDEQTNRQQQFNTTMQRFSTTNKAENDRFNALVQQDKRLFEHQKKLSEATSGILVPGSEPTPKSLSCSAHASPEDFLLILGDNTILVRSFPHVVMVSRSRGPLISLVRSNNGNIAVVMDIRDLTGRIVARLGKDGYFVGSRLAVEKPDKSTLSVIDEFGAEAVRVRYLNPHAMSISGYMNRSQGEFEPIEVRGMRNSCLGSFGPGGTDISVP